MVGENENVTGDTELKTDTYDLVILGASGFTGNYQKTNLNNIRLTLNHRSICRPVCVQSFERAWNNMGCGRFSFCSDV